jgi:pimeloyl-ACP methyl ester carboxylesterase
VNHTLLACALTVFFSAHAVAQQESSGGATDPRSFTASDGREVRFLLFLPDAFEQVRPLPVLVALPPGRGDLPTARAAIREYWSDAHRRGWAVASPLAPDTGWGREISLLKQWLDHLSTLVRPENGLVHLAGVSAGGLAAFALAVDDPARFASLTVLPGAPPDPGVFSRLHRLRTVPTTIFVGAEDADFWLPQARAAAARMKELGFECDLHELPAQGHRLRVDPGELADLLDSRRPSMRAARLAREGAIRQVAGVLDDFHNAAAKADEVRYFDHFAPDAVFLGTDAGERWTLAQFRRYAAPHFAAGRGWTYTPTVRHVTISPDGSVAWFDEMLDNARYGTCRGTGVLVRIEGRWRIAQYHLTKPVPNDLMDELVELEKKEMKP